MPVATSIMSGSIETIPTQPSVRSPKWTLPSRPPVMPPSRPMYWARMRARRDAADEVRRRGRGAGCTGGPRRPSRRRRRPRRPPGRSRRRTSRAPCPGGRGSSRAPRCRASAACAQERDAVVERQVLGYGSRCVGARRLGRHRACCSFRGRGPARDRRARPRLAPWPGSPGCAGVPLTPGSGGAYDMAPYLDGRWARPSGWPRLRWRHAGRVAVAGVRGAVRGRGAAARSAAVPGDDGPGALRRRAARGLRQPRRRRGRRAAGWAPGCAGAGRDLPGVVARDHAGTGCWSPSAVRASWPAGSLHHSGRAGRARRPAALRRRRARFVISQAPREFQANARPARHRRAEADLYRTCVTGPSGSRASACSSTPTSRRPASRATRRAAEHRPAAVIWTDVGFPVGARVPTVRA